MSAYVVHPDTISLIIDAANTYELMDTYRDIYPHVTPPDSDRELREAVGRYLASLNVRSVAYRYPSDKLDTLPGYRYEEYLSGMLYSPMPAYKYVPTPYAFAVKSESVDICRRVLGALACFEYQACELPEWQGTPAFRFCQGLRRHLASVVAEGWEYDRNEANVYA